STKTEDKEHRLQCPKVRIGRKKLAAAYSYFSGWLGTGLLLLQLMHNFLFIYYHHIFEALHRGREREREGHRGPDPDHPETRYAEEVGDRQQQQQVIILMHLGWIYVESCFFLDRNKNMEILINRNCFSTTDLQFENLETKEKLYVVRAVLLWLNYEFSDLE
ncbi:hypothetical protein ACJX0J_031082, partial [Zea mays]